jgi:hypothetical protein
VTTEDHGALAAVARRQHDAMQVFERDLEAPLADERNGAAVDDAEPPAVDDAVAQVIGGGGSRVAARERVGVFERLRPAILDPDLEVRYPSDELVRDEHEVAGAACDAGNEDEHALRLGRADLAHPHAVVRSRTGSGGSAHGNVAVGRREERERAEQDREQVRPVR